ncbi:MAG: tRNA lysidine(34) synthetase TilS, partial [Alphaproteobacteria bacterium]|nr:tRNA lysidine(34) synthetase TilS [Alphaproteobacteria bacterium]
MTLATRLQAHIQELSLLHPGDRLIVGVSGGPDSVALFRLLYTLRHEWGLQLHVAHYNHRWRSDADKDEQFVKDLAHGCGIPHTVGRSRQAPGGTGTGSAEEKARLARLRFFKKTLRQTGFNAVVLAHTKDDLAETVLMRIIRGTGLQGLRAMQPCTTFD